MRLGRPRKETGTLTLVRIFGIAFAAMGIVFLLRPAMADRLVVVLQEGSRQYLNVALRLVIGVVLVSAAPQCRFVGVITTLGIFFLATGLGGVVLGLGRMRSWLQWMHGWPPAVVRVWALLPTALGVFLLYATVPSS